MPRSSSYAPPTPLEDLHILDYLELAGSQAKAGQVLNLHQTTVCRSLRLMQNQFRLVPRRGSMVCRHGENACLLHLRLAYREHRLMAGVLRLGTDLLHQGLLREIAGLQAVPPRARSSRHWAELVRHGLLDGAIVSSFCFPLPLPADAAPSWDELVVEALGPLRLQLAGTAPDLRSVLLPRRKAAPVLHQLVQSHGYEVEQQPAACQEAAAWLKRSRDRGLAIPVCPALQDASWLAAHRLVPLADQPPLREQLWLLLPQEALHHPVVRRFLGELRMRMAPAAPGDVAPRSGC